MRLSNNNGYQPLPTFDDNSQSTTIKAWPIARSSSDNTFLPSNSAKSQHSLPYKTKRFIKRRLSAAGLKTRKMSGVSFAPLPATIRDDIDNGELIESEDEKGWIVVKRHRKRKHAYDRGASKARSKRGFKSIFVKHGPLDEQHNQMTWNHLPPLTKEGYMAVIHSVQEAIDQKMYPTRISQGSSGSYFCRDTSGKIVGVFKPKNEEPYGHLNPKWTKWVHRNLFPCCFGRSCLIPNLGYMSEAATSLIDRRLKLNIVPFTDVVHLSSPTFHYDRSDRKASNPQLSSPRPLPSKIGSFQCFLNDFNDAGVFLRNHPFPTDAFYSSSRTVVKKRSLVFNCLGAAEDDDDIDQEMQGRVTQREQGSDKQGFQWTKRLQQQFKREFENLAILDYLIRNTDRGTDNWMIRYCPEADSVRIARGQSSGPVNAYNTTAAVMNADTSIEFSPNEAHIHVAAIDNGLAFPFKHPDKWRSYPYAWLSLPHSLLIQPISVETRQKLLPMLSDPEWWSETVRDLQRLFSLDSDFEPRMFERQLAVMKGQGWNIVQTLLDPSAGILDMVTRQRTVVWEDDLLIEWDQSIIDEREKLRGPLAEHAPPASDRNFPAKSREPEVDADDDGVHSDPEIGPAGSFERASRLESNYTEPSSATDASDQRKRRWNDRLRRSFSLDRVSKHIQPSSPHQEDANASMRQSHITVERIEIVESSNPYFTCC
ncbi:hypothetical protein INT43_002391 [Umbelopsis isabellina]|uniref:Phosphatidylinositol 4-kinase n=1 Tax=Mortierella isabellina TaxID=91625 RepID=A0A8H7Q632_MORIS|nr:hypothetical protein INT43_002391 [Umbelopsis isabellina]